MGTKLPKLSLMCVTVVNVVYDYDYYIGVGQIFVTDDVKEFLARIGDLNVQSTGNGRVSVVDAILCAARASQPDSTIFVFTDSSATDKELLGRAEAVISEKNLKVNFIQDFLTTSKRSLHMKQMHKGKMHHKRQSTDDVYEELEMFSDGQIIKIPLTDISELASFVSFSAVSGNTIFRQAGSTLGSIEYSFPVDSYTSEILIFVNGQNINVSVLTPQGKLFSILSVHISHRHRK